MLPILLVLAANAPIEPGLPISADSAWAVAPEGPRTYLERVTGKRIDPRTITPIREGDMVFDGESMARDIVAQFGEPIESLDHDPTPGVLVLAMNGVTLKRTCPGTQTANGALNCTPLVDKETNFPAVASEQKRNAIFQEISNFYEDFDLVISTARPPDWLPYTLSVIGGTSTNAGYENGVCGIANVACDGAKRNHVSLSFHDSCPNDASLTAGQETAHNWGLEHTDVEADIMYPFVVGAGEFLNNCMDISHATGNGQTQCTHVHKVYCPQGDGEQQNSYGELMGVFGPRRVDTVKPTIIEMSPPDGSVFDTLSEVKVAAKISDDSNFLGVKWTWVEGLPPGFEDGYTRCTNDVCTDGYGAWKGLDETWDFINLKKPPAGHYVFKLELMDAYANKTSQTIEFDVVPAQGGSDTGDDTTGDLDTTAGSAETNEAPTTGGGDDETGGDTDATPTEGAEDSNGTTPNTTMTGVTGVTATDPGGDEEDGCGCRSSPGPSLAALGMVLLGLRRRRAR